MSSMTTYSTSNSSSSNSETFFPISIHSHPHPTTLSSSSSTSTTSISSSSNKCIKEAFSVLDNRSNFKIITTPNTNPYTGISNTVHFIEIDGHQVAERYYDTLTHLRNRFDENNKRIKNFSYPPIFHPFRCVNCVKITCEVATDVFLKLSINSDRSAEVFYVNIKNSVDSNKYEIFSYLPQYVSINDLSIKVFRFLQTFPEVKSGYYLYNQHGMVIMANYKTMNRFSTAAADRLDSYYSQYSYSHYFSSEANEKFTKFDGLCFVCRPGGAFENCEVRVLQIRENNVPTQIYRTENGAFEWRETAFPIHEHKFCSENAQRVDLQNLGLSFPPLVFERVIVELNKISRDLAAGKLINHTKEKVDFALDLESTASVNPTHDPNGKFIYKISINNKRIVFPGHENHVGNTNSVLCYEGTQNLTVEPTTLPAYIKLSERDKESAAKNTFSCVYYVDISKVVQEVCYQAFSELPTSTS